MGVEIMSVQLIEKFKPDSFIIIFLLYHFNWMWVEITLSAQFIEKSTPV